MSESDTRQHVRSNLKWYGRLTYIENLIQTGTPDLSYTLRRKPILPAVTGWLELKFLSTLPKRNASPVVLRRLTLEQVLWLEAERDAGGRAWLLLQVGGWHFLMLKPDQVRRLYDRQYISTDLLRDCWNGEEGFPTKHILTLLTSEPEHGKGLS